VPDAVKEPKEVPQPETQPELPPLIPGIPRIPRLIPEIPGLERGLAVLEEKVEKFFNDPASMVLGAGGFGPQALRVFPAGARFLAKLKLDPKLLDIFKKPPPKDPPTPSTQGQPQTRPDVKIIETKLPPRTPEQTPVPPAPGQSGKGAQLRDQAKSDAATDMMGDRLERELGRSLRKPVKRQVTLGPARPPVRGDELQKFIDNPVIKPGSIADFMNLGDNIIRRKFIQYMKGAAKTKEGKPNFGMDAKFLRQMDLVEGAAAPPKIDDDMFRFILNFFKKYRLSPTRTIDKMKESGMVEETTLKNPNIQQLINRAERAAESPKKQFIQREPSKKVDTSSIKYNTGFDTLIVIMRPRPRPLTVNV